MRNGFLWRKGKEGVRMKRQKRKLRRVLALVLAAMMVLSLPVTSFAEAEGNPDLVRTEVSCTKDDGCVAENHEDGCPKTKPEEKAEEPEPEKSAVSEDEAEPNEAETRKPEETEEAEQEDSGNKDTETSAEVTETTSADEEKPEDMENVEADGAEPEAVAIPEVLENVDAGSRQVELSGVQAQMDAMPAAEMPEAADPVAMAGETGYATLAEAIQATQPGQVVTVTRDTEIMSKITVDKALTLDLNGKTVTTALKKAVLVAEGGSLTVQDSAGGGTLTYSSAGAAQADILLEVEGNFTLNGGTLDSNGGYTIKATGGASTVNGGVVRNRFKNNGGAAFYVAKGAAGTVSGGRVLRENNNGRAFYVEGGATGTVCSGEIRSNGTVAVYLTTNSAFYMTGGTIIQESNQESIGLQNKTYVYAISAASGPVTISMAGGTVISSQRGMNYKIGGDSREAAELSGVTIDAKTYAFYDTTALNVSGGSNVKAGKAVFGYPAGSSAVVAVNDGVFEASELLDTTDVSGKQITIAGGTFKGMTKDMLENHVAEGATATETDGVVTVGPAEVEEPVAQVGSTTYQSLEEAIEAAGAGQTVTLLRDTELAEAITVDKALTLDLNGCAIATANGKNPSAFTVEAGGNLTVTDSSESETGKIVHEKEETGVLVLVKGGFTLEKGTLDSRSVDTLRVEGGSAVVNGGKVYNRCSFGYNTSRAFRVVTGSGIVNGGLLDCGGRQGYAFSLDENGTAEINGGTVTGNGMAAVLFNKAGTMTITGGTIEQTGSQSNTSAVYYMNSATGKLTVTGGTINSTLYGIYAPVNNAMIEVSDVAITAKQAFCTRKITVSGENTAVKADTVFYTMYINDSDNLIEGGTFEAGKLVEGTKKDYKVLITGGTFKGGISDTDFEGRLAEGYAAGQQDEGTYVVAVAKDYAAKDSNGKKYETLAEALENAQAGAVITVLKDIELSETLTVDKTLVLDLAGHTVKNDAALEAALLTVAKSGNLTVRDSSETGGRFVGESDRDVKCADMIVISGAFCLESGILENQGYAGISTLSVESAGTADITGGTVRGNVPGSSSVSIMSKEGSAVTVSAGLVELVAGGDAIKANGTVTVSGESRVQSLRSFAVDIEKGSFTLKDNAVVELLAGEMSSGNAIRVSTWAKKAVVNIEGGTIKTPAGSSGCAIGSRSTDCTLTISGGNIESDYAFDALNAVISDVNVNAGEAVFYAWRNGAGYVNKVSGGNFAAPQFAYISGKTANLQAELTGGTYKGGMTKGELDKYTAKEPKELEAKETEIKGVFIIVEKETPVDPTDPIDPTDPTDPTNPTVPTNPTNPTVPTNPTSPSPAAPANPNGGGTRPAGGVTGTVGTAGTGAAGTNATPESAESTEDLIANAGQIDEERVPLNSGSDLEAGTEPSESVPETEEVKDIGEEDVPLAAAAKADGWALLNLLGLLIALAAGVLGVFGKSQDDKKKAAEKAAGIVAAVAALVTFVLTQHMTGEVVIADKWTVLMLLYAAAGIVLLGLGKLRKVSRMSK